MTTFLSICQEFLCAHVLLITDCSHSVMLVDVSEPVSKHSVWYPLEVPDKALIESREGLES